MSEKDKEIFRMHIGHLLLLIEIYAWPKMIYVLTEYWDYDKMVFSFGEVELTPTIEEAINYYKSIDMCFKWSSIPNNNILVPTI